jgi:hypothetical protein
MEDGVLCVNQESTFGLSQYCSQLLLGHRKADYESNRDQPHDARVRLKKALSDTSVRLVCARQATRQERTVPILLINGL